MEITVRFFNKFHFFISVVTKTNNGPAKVQEALPRPVPKLVSRKMFSFFPSFAIIFSYFLVLSCLSFPFLLSFLRFFLFLFHPSYRLLIEFAPFFRLSVPSFLPSFISFFLYSFLSLFHSSSFSLSLLL